MQLRDKLATHLQESSDRGIKGDFYMQQLEAELLQKRLPLSSCGF